MIYKVLKVTAILMAGVLFATGCAGVTHTVELGFFHYPPPEVEDDRSSNLRLGATVDMAFGVKGMETVEGCGSVQYSFSESTDDGYVSNSIPTEFCTEWDFLELGNVGSADEVAR